MTAPSRTAPPSVVQTETGWRINRTCHHCDEPFTLLVDEKPSELTLKLAKLTMCDGCAAALENDDYMRRAKIDFDQRLQASHLPREFHGARWSGLDDSGERAHVVAAARSWVQRGRGLVLCGPVGTGKTRIAATAALAILMEGGHIRWISAPELLTMAGASYSSVERRQALSILLGQDPLVLDDLDRLHTGESSQGFLLSALDGRINRGVPLCITTNLRPSQIGERLGEAIMSRVAGNYFGVYELRGDDRRLEDA